MKRRQYGFFGLLHNEHPSSVINSPCGFFGPSDPASPCTVGVALTGRHPVRPECWSGIQSFRQTRSTELHDCLPHNGCSAPAEDRLDRVPAVEVEQVGRLSHFHQKILPQAYCHRGQGVSI